MRVLLLFSALLSLAWATSESHEGSGSLEESSSQEAGRGPKPPRPYPDGFGGEPRGPPERAGGPKGWDPENKSRRNRFKWPLREDGGHKRPMDVPPNNRGPGMDHDERDAGGRPGKGPEPQFIPPKFFGGPRGAPPQRPGGPSPQH
ncbi:uncharacterized protein [Pleurodeles waltl]|uniref:uncharacterized protein isoform X1 n=1 Tax=Pleurodeles waltl TaxID=8319 RepID=UPI0037096508